MGVDIGRNGEGRRFGHAGWASLLGVARAYGWQPMGSIDPINTSPDREWNGNYSSNDGQWVRPEDAAAFGDALETYLLQSEKEFGKEDADQIKELIEFSRGGGFIIC